MVLAILYTTETGKTKPDRILVTAVLKFQVFSFNRDLRRNLCRNPDGDKAPWCYTLDPRVRWEYCNLEKCFKNPPRPSPTSPSKPQLPSTNTQTPPEKGAFFNLWNVSLLDPQYAHLFLSGSVLDCKVGNGDTYRGPTSITILGVTCQAWSAQSPHQHNSFTPQTHPTKGLEGNVSVCGPMWTILSCRPFCFRFNELMLKHTIFVSS